MDPCTIMYNNKRQRSVFFSHKIKFIVKYILLEKSTTNITLTERVKLSKCKVMFPSYDRIVIPVLRVSDVFFAFESWFLLVCENYLASSLKKNQSKSKWKNV